MKRLCKNKYWNIQKEHNLNKILYLLIDRPNIINSYNVFIWKNKKGNFHRDYNLPAYVSVNGFVEWYKNNVLHRKNNKPAIIRCDGSKEYFINDKFIKEEK